MAHFLKKLLRSTVRRQSLYRLRRSTLGIGRWRRQFPVAINSSLSYFDVHTF